MQNVTVTWSTKNCWKSNVDSCKIEEMDQKGFYQILLAKHDLSKNQISDGTLLYIGQAFNQTIRERVLQPHDSDECIEKWKKSKPGYDLFVNPGIVTEAGQKTLTQVLFDDIECCTIYMNQPKCNTQCKEGYDGRDIKISHINAWIIKNSECTS